jgi:hypothetical protein
MLLISKLISLRFNETLSKKLKDVIRKFERKHIYMIKKLYDQGNIYVSIVNLEKFLVILFSFIWLYLLSFILWTEGVNNYNLDLFRSNRTVILNDELDNYASSVCNTFEFAVKFISLFQIIFSFVRLVVLVVNIVVGLLYIFRFRCDHLETICNTFRKEISGFEKKRFTLKNWIIYYSTEQNVIDNKLAKFGHINKIIQLHYEHLKFINFYAIFVLFYSVLLFPGYILRFDHLLTKINNKIKDGPSNMNVNLWNLKSLINNSKANASLDLFSVALFDEQYSMINLTASDLFLSNDHIEINYKEFYKRLAENLAHSSKFIIYFLFSKHFKFFFTYKKNEIEIDYV